MLTSVTGMTALKFKPYQTDIIFSELNPTGTLLIK
jgi:hypothetical protein